MNGQGDFAATLTGWAHQAGEIALRVAVTLASQQLVEAGCFQRVLTHAKSSLVEYAEVVLSSAQARPLGFAGRGRVKMAESASGENEWLAKTSASRRSVTAR
jgi:hypothetical protein